ncbi:MAG: NADPH-dependent F420 reductase [Alphaproteobacteria bacterium]|nr:NADPH-dependent F420 reductase [Alphaproteobacteria bacterium]
MRIAIIGAGQVGGALAQAWVRAGHDIVLGTRDAKAADVMALAAKLGPKTTSASQPEAAKAGDVIVLTTPWNASEAVATSLGDLGGKILIDCTNPLGMKDGALALVIGHTDSGAERIARAAPSARVYKSFNQTGFEIMGNTSALPEKPVMFVAGDDAAGKATVLELTRALGFDAIDAGPLKAARLLEPLAQLWISLAMKGDLGRKFALRLVRA